MFIEMVFETTTMTPEKAKIWQKYNCYEGQRTLIKNHCKKLKTTMLNGGFSHGDVCFAQTSDGKEYLMNGQHTIKSCITSGENVRVAYSVYYCETNEDLRKLYGSFNTDKSRTQQDIIKSLIASSDINWPLQIASTLVSAHADINKDNKLISRDNTVPLSVRAEEIFNIRKEGDVIVELLKKYKNPKEFKKCDTVIPMLMTYNANKNKFYDFWDGVMGIDFREGSADPRAIARKFIKETSTSNNVKNVKAGGVVHKVKYIATIILCWNKWINNEECQKTPWMRRDSDFPRALR